MIDSGFRIGRIKIHNFKNFKDLDISLNKFNVIVGPNASGKSNFTQVFAFLQNIITNGLEYAIAEQGGNRYIRNLSNNDKKLEMEFQFVSDVSHEIPKLRPRGSVTNKVFTNDITYKFSIQLGDGSNYKILYDILEFSCQIEIDEYVRNKKLIKKFNGTVIISKKNKTITWDYDAPAMVGSIIQKQYQFFEFSPLTSKQLLAESRVFGFLVPGLGEFLDSIGIYDFEPKLLKQPSTIRSKAKLEHNGSNLSLVLHNIVKDDSKKKTFENLVSDLLPFFKSIKLDHASDLSVGFNLREDSSSKESIPAIFVSDGTVNIMAIITCLFLQQNKLTIIEEPERNMHPALLSKILGFMQEASFNNQIIITTHNPVILDFIKLENTFLVNRNGKGVSRIYKAENSDIVKQFKNSMSVGKLMTKNLLR